MSTGPVTSLKRFTGGVRARVGPGAGGRVEVAAGVGGRVAAAPEAGVQLGGTVRVVTGVGVGASGVSLAAGDVVVSDGWVAVNVSGQVAVGVAPGVSNRIEVRSTVGSGMSPPVNSKGELQASARPNSRTSIPGRRY